MDKAYRDHPVFTELDVYIDFYDSFSMAVMDFATIGTTSMINMDTYIYSSIQGTIESIKILLEKERINDSYSLLKKYYDSSIINVYSNLYIENNCGVDRSLADQINNWLHGKDKLPENRVMSQYIRDSERLKAINVCLYSDTRYKNIKGRCDDHAHYSYFQQVMLNDNEVFIENKIESLDNLSKDLKDIFILHMSYIFSLHQHYMMSSDYLDHLKYGKPSPENSQYWVAPFIKKIFDEVVKKNRPDIASVILSNTSKQLSVDHA